MKANEVQIGDWVISNKEGKNEIVKVVSIDGGTNCCWLDADCYSGLVACKDIEPIPLTVEIMKKNNYDTGQVSWWEDDDNIHIFIGSDTMGMEGRFYSVHELQHALRLCGLTELADNFKVWED